MNSPSNKSLPEIQTEAYKKRRDIIRDTANQIIKDFRLYDLTVEFSGNAETAYDELFTQIHPLIRDLFISNFSLFSELLYRIDLHEKYLPDMQNEEDFETVSHMIIDRELKKVIIRAYYKKEKEKQQKLKD